MLTVLRTASIFTFILCLIVFVSPVKVHASTQYLYESNTLDDSVNVIDPVTGSTVKSISVPNQPEGLVSTENYVYVAQVNSASIAVIDTATNTVTTTIQLPPGNFPDVITLSPDKTRAYVGEEGPNGNVFVVDTTSNTVLTTLSGFAEVQGLALNADGSKLYAVNTNYLNTDGFVTVVDTATYATLATIHVGANPIEIALTPDGTKGYVTNNNGAFLGDTVSVIDTASNTVTKTITVGVNPFGIRMNTAGTKVYVVDSDYWNGGNTNSVLGDVSVINTATDEVETTIPVGYVPTLAAFSPDNSKLYVTNQNSNSISVIDPNTNTVVQTISGGNHPYGLTFAFGTDLPPQVALHFTPNGSNGWFTTTPASGSVTVTTSTGSNQTVASVTCQGAQLTNVSGLGTKTVTGTLTVSAQGETNILCQGIDSSTNSGEDQVTVKIDSVNPTCTAVATPNKIWPPNKKLENVNIVLTPADATSGLASVPFVLNTLTSTETLVPSDYPGFVIGTAATSGQLRTKKNGQVYNLGYFVSDNAGNTNTCSTSVSVTH